MATLLVRAIRATFQRRATALPNGLPIALTSTFATDVLKITQWRAFVRKSGVNGGGELAAAVAAIVEFAQRRFERRRLQAHSRCVGCRAAHGGRRLAHARSIVNVTTAAPMMAIGSSGTCPSKRAKGRSG
jgi:hypothetical protein